MCFAPLIQADYRDTLTLDAFCVQDRVVLTGAGVPLVRVNPSRCDVAVQLTTSVAPQQYFMEQNFPNPASGGFTTVRVGLAETTFVRFSVYTPLGETIAVPIDGVVQAGILSVNIDVSKLESGVYFYELRTGATRIVKRFIVVQ